MARIAYETSGVCEHAHESAEQSKHGQTLYLASHSRFLIKEPPPGAELHLSRNASVVEVIGHAHKGLIVFRVQTVENGFCQFAFISEPVEKPVACFGERKIID